MPAGVGARRLRRLVRPRSVEPHPDVVRLTPEDRRYLTSFYDDSVPLPPGAERILTSRNPRLQELRDTYARLELPVTAASRWNASAVESFLDLRWFRGESLITWHRRELPRVTSLKYFVLMQYVASRDSLDMLRRLGEDGAFGCWTFDYPGWPKTSRDLIESVNELSFLERSLTLSERERFSVLDIGAGYGRLAHRAVAAYPHLRDYCCVDAVPESTFISEYYLHHRGVAPRARAVSLDRVGAELLPGAFDLAVNIHSFSECTHAAVEWWVAMLRRLEVPWLLVVPNEPDELLTLEPDGERRDFRGLIERAGYRLASSEPVVDDPAVREVVDLHDHFYLFSLET
jgi:SAM-dependent methyltransferase